MQPSPDTHSSSQDKRFAEQEQESGKGSSLDQQQQKQQPECSQTFDNSVTLEQLRQLLAQFAEDRNWGQFHTPRNLVMALTGEIGELNELFQWSVL